MMDSEDYSKSILSTISNPPTMKLSMEIDNDSKRNAANCMTALLCNRLSASGKSTERESGTPFDWDDGIINIKNAVKPFLWTNLPLNVVKNPHGFPKNRPAAYLMACWQPGEETMRWTPK